MDPVRPAYGGPSLERVVPALVRREPPAWMPEPVREAEAVVLLVLDGLGWSAVESYRSRLPVMGAMTGRSITTVVPSTTASALTSLATGLTPAEHGVMGFRMRVDNAMLNVLRWQVPYGHRPPDPFVVQRHTAFLGRSVPVVTKREFRKTGFTEAHLRGGAFHGWSALSTLVEHCRRLVGNGERFVYAYYPGIDAVAHELGLSDGYFAEELRFADDLVGRLLEALPERAAVVVTADHGQVDVGPNGWVSIAALEEMVAQQGGDGRFRYLYAKRGSAAALLEAARDEVGGQAWVMSRDQLFEEGWFGPGSATASVRRRVGDVVLAARDPVAFVDPAMPNEPRLLGAHGSVTPDEMEVPLLAARGRGRR
jgi:hypothetical protein